MKRNRDLKAELVEMRLAAQQWEDKYVESLHTLEDVRTMRDAAEKDYSAQIIELRSDLGQASRELLAVTEQLDVCRLERGEALDKLAATMGPGEETRADLNMGDDFEVTQPGG
jgi:hypothetical protein